MVCSRDGDDQKEFVHIEFKSDTSHVKNQKILFGYGNQK